MINFISLEAVERERERESYTLLNKSKGSFCVLLNNNIIKNKLGIDYLSMCVF